MQKKNPQFFISFSVIVIISTALSCIEINKKDAKSIFPYGNFKNDTIYLSSEIKPEKKITFYIEGDLNKYSYGITIKSNTIGYVRKIVSSDTLVLIEGSKFTPFFLLPGERVISRENKNGNVILEIADDVVRNNELLFFVKLNEAIPWPSAPKIKIVTERDFLNVAAVYRLAYTKSIDFLIAFSKKNTISEQFHDFSKRYLYYKYLMFLLNPSIYGNTQNVRKLLNEYKREFKKDKEIIIPTYLMAAYNYSLLLLTPPINKITFEEHFNVIKENFQNNTQKYLLYRNLINNIDKETSKPEYKKSVVFFMEKYSSDTLCKLFTQNFDYLNNNQSFLQNDEYQNEKLLKADGKLISWNEMLMLYKGKIIYIDFWATWCGPCIHEIPFSKELKNQFPFEKIAFVYISCDVEKLRWLNALSELDINSDNGNYLFTVPDNSLIKKTFFINSIPRYMIFDKDGTLVDKNAMNPSNPKLKSLLDKLITN